jgi:UDP-glucuronate 4-epimerase
MMKVLVTGAAGFIGFHSAKALNQLDHFVIGIDNFNTYYDPTLKRARAEELAKQGMVILEVDLSETQTLSSIIEKEEITHILHLAAQAGVRYSLENPSLYIQSNVQGFLNILELCRSFPHLTLVYASSSSVYGLNQKVPFSLEDRTDSQASLYGVTKKSNELMASSYHHLYGIRVTGLRFFTVYGPWGRPDMAYFLFTKAILQKQPINLFNFGKMKRDFTYIDDIVAGIIAALQLSSPNAIFNLGHHQPEELIYLIELLEKELGCKAKKNLLPMQLADVFSTYADISESQKLLNFEPKTSLKEGIPQFINWYRTFYQV